MQIFAHVSINLHDDACLSTCLSVDLVWGGGEQGVGDGHKQQAFQAYSFIPVTMIAPLVFIPCRGFELAYGSQGWRRAKIVPTHFSTDHSRILYCSENVSLEDPHTIHCC